MVEKIRKDEVDVLPDILIERYGKRLRKRWPELRRAILDAKPGHKIKVIYEVTLEIGEEVIGVRWHEP